MHVLRSDDEKQAIFYNGDMSGEAIITTYEPTQYDGRNVDNSVRVTIPANLLLKFAANYIRLNLISKIEQMNDDEILKGEWK